MVIRPLILAGPRLTRVPFALKNNGVPVRNIFIGPILNRIANYPFPELLFQEIEDVLNLS